MSRQLGSIGSQLDQALEQAAAEGHGLNLPRVDKRLTLCCLRVHKKPAEAGNLTVSAMERQHGDIILGPYAHRRQAPTMENLLGGIIEGQRWHLNQVKMGVVGHGPDGKERCVITAAPTIVRINRVDVRCTNPTCGHHEVEAKDLLRQRSKMQDGGSDGDRKIPLAMCKKCKKTYTAVTEGDATVLKPTLELRYLRNTAIAKTGENDDPILTDADREQVLEAMAKFWAEHPEPTEPTIHLPRIWAVYRKDRIPDPSWTPQDPRAKLLADKAAANRKRVGDGANAHFEPYPAAILPYEIAQKYHRGTDPISNALISFQMEAEAIQVGWVRKQDLIGTAAGFRRDFWFKPQEVRAETPLSL